MAKWVLFYIYFPIMALQPLPPLYTKAQRQNRFGKPHPQNAYFRCKHHYISCKPKAVLIFKSIGHLGYPQKAYYKKAAF